MSGWVVFALYALGAGLSWRSLTMSLLHDLEAIAQLSNSDRAAAASFGALAALLWPLSLPVRWAWRLIKNANVLETPKEKLAAQSQESPGDRSRGGGR